MTTQFLPRQTFQYSHKLVWYPGHQPKALSQLIKGIDHIDLILEVRDARIPLSSTNPRFEETLSRKNRLIIFNKYDLCNMNLKNNIINAFKRRGQDVLFTSTTNDQSVKNIIKYAIQMNRNNPQIYPSISMVVVGLPNVGKSSLLNRLRYVGVKKGKVAQVGPFAGVTQTIQTRVKLWEDPSIYLVDTPGIFCPNAATPIQGLKIALTGGSKDRMTDEYHVADYLLFNLNKSPHIERYTSLYGLERPTNNIDELLFQVAKKEKLLSVMNRFNSNEAAKRLIQAFRSGQLGNITLDECSEESLERWFDGMEYENMDDIQTETSPH